MSVTEGGRPPVRVRGARTYSNQAGSVSEALRTAADHILLHENENPGNVTCDAFSLWFDPNEWVWYVGYTLEGCAEELSQNGPHGLSGSSDAVRQNPPSQQGD